MNPALLVDLKQSAVFEDNISPYDQLGAVLMSKHFFNPSLQVVSVGPAFSRLLEVVEFGDVCLPMVLIEVLLPPTSPDEETSVGA